MKCPNCNTVLVAKARYCPVCGAVLPTFDNPASPTSAPPFEVATNLSGYEPTPFQPGSGPTPTSKEPQPPRFALPQPASQPPSFAPQSPVSWQGAGPQTTPAPQPSSFAPQSPVSLMGSGPAPRRVRRTKLGGCLLRIALVLVVLLIVLTGAWFLVLRPSFHTTAENEMGQMLSNSLGQVNPLLTSLAPANIPLPISESLIRQALVLPSPSWFTIQNLQLSITPQSIGVNFQVQVAAFTFACAVTSVPQVVNGEVEIQSMTLDGPISLVTSSDDIKAEVNGYLQQLHDQIQRPIKTLTLGNQLLWVTLG